MKKILVVDDDLVSREKVKVLLKKNNYEIVLAVDGKDVIEKAKAENPDMIIMDVIMPKMSGGDAVRLLQDCQETKDIPVMFLTGVGVLIESLDTEESMVINGKNYPSLGKPFKNEWFLEVIKKIHTVNNRA